MSFTTNLNSGEWSKPELVVPSSVDLNLSPLIFSNGSLLALYRDNTGSNIHIITASNWRQPSSYTRHPANLPGGVCLPEDPFLYMDKEGRFHSIHHGYPWPNGQSLSDATNTLLASPFSFSLPLSLFRHTYTFAYTTRAPEHSFLPSLPTPHLQFTACIALERVSNFIYAGTTNICVVILLMMTHAFLPFGGWERPACLLV